MAAAGARRRRAQSPAAGMPRRAPRREARSRVDRQTGAGSRGRRGYRTQAWAPAAAGSAGRWRTWYSSTSARPSRMVRRRARSFVVGTATAGGRVAHRGDRQRPGGGHRRGAARQHAAATSACDRVGRPRPGLRPARRPRGHGSVARCTERHAVPERRPRGQGHAAATGPTRSPSSTDAVSRRTVHYAHDPDGWTLRTASGARAAHSEHTVARDSRRCAQS